MKTEIIVIGNELLKGMIADKNISYLASTLFNINHKLEHASIVSDNHSHICEQLKISLKRSDCIFVTGGLGPTKDDITKESIALFFGKKLITTEQAFNIAKSHYHRTGRPFQPEKNKYDIIPEDFTALYNPSGSAPGLFYEENGKKIFCLPGVPREFKTMLSKSVLSLIETKNKTFRKQLSFKTWKLPEEKIFSQIDSSLWVKLEKFGSVSSLPHHLGVDIGVEIESPNKEDLSLKEIEINSIIEKSPLNEYVWQVGNETLEEYIIKFARKKGLTFGFAESCSGGHASSLITNIPGCSDVFLGSVISYSNSLKENILEVSSDILRNYGAVSAEVAKEMAQGGIKALGVDICISMTGIAGPGGGSKEKPIGTVGIGLATKDEASSELFLFFGDRIQLKDRFARAGLFTLLQEIKNR